jgi:hypothetical protein
MDSNTLVKPMVETLEVVECVEELAALDGVTSLLVGTNDMTSEMDIPGNYKNFRLIEVYEKKHEKCKKHEKWVGIEGIPPRVDTMEKFCSLGAMWVMAPTDGPLLLGDTTGKATEVAQLRQRVKEPSSAPVKVKSVHGNGVVAAEKTNGMPTSIAKTCFYITGRSRNDFVKSHMYDSIFFGSF